jgi:hypothetical protein
MDRSYAKIMAKAATQSLALLADALPAIRDGVSPDEYNLIRRRIGGISADIITDILNPICDAHLGLEAEVDAELGRRQNAVD